MQEAWPAREKIAASVLLKRFMNGNRRCRVPSG